MPEMTALDQRITTAFPFDLGREAELIVAAYVGSISHNTYVPNDDPDAIDDVDILGAALPPVQRLVGLDPWNHFTLQQDELDVTIFSLHRLVELWLKSNPNVLGLLWLRPEHYLYRGEAFEAFHAILRGVPRHPRRVRLETGPQIVRRLCALPIARYP